MGMVVLFLLLLIVFILMVWLEVKKYQQRLANIESHLNQSMDQIKKYNQKQPSVGTDLQKERLYRVKKQEVDQMIEDEYNARQSAS